MSNTCNVCCSEYTAQARKKVTCAGCGYEACTKCIKTFLLSTVRAPQCMNCAIGWNREFLDEVLSKHFRETELKKHRENILLQREKCMLPDTIPLVENELRKRELTKQVQDITEERRILIQQLAEVNERLERTRIALIRGGQYQAPPKASEKPTFKRPCPAEDCRGFLSANSKCSLCKAVVCAHCNVVKYIENNQDENVNDTHKCKDEDLETMKLLKKDTKYCPNASCGVPIFRVSGCPQMFCTSCKTAFDWNTGKIELNHNRIHNPHYYEYLRRQNGGIIPRNEGDIVGGVVDQGGDCGRLPTYNTVLRHLINNKIKVNVSKQHRLILHIQYDELPRYPIVEPDGDVFANLRVKYLLKEISEDDWKKELQKIDKKNDRNTTYRQALSMFIDVATDSFRKMMQTSNEKQVQQILGEMEELRKYFNEVMTKIKHRFDSSRNIAISENWLMGILCQP